MRTKSTSADFAFFGAAPEFETPIHVGQLYIPSWERYKDVFHGIFSRQYYTNQGPLTAELERRLSVFLNVKHAICVTNASIGLIMAAEAMMLKGRVILPAFASISNFQSLSWADLEPVFCDVNPTTHHISVEHLTKLIEYDKRDISAVLAANQWGGSCDIDALQSLTKAHNISLYFDSIHAFGSQHNGVPIGNFGDMEIFSFLSHHLIGGVGGGFISTNNDLLAARLRNIRSSYGSGPPIAVTKTSNGRMSEAQAAIALLSLEDYPSTQEKNKQFFELYKTHIDQISGMRLLEPALVDNCNYRYVCCEIDAHQFGLTRNNLIDILKAENLHVQHYFGSDPTACNRYTEKFSENANVLFPNAEKIDISSVQFPIGPNISEQVIERIGKLVKAVHIHASDIRSRIGGVN
jgi:dTDP-4-amino-4,6-dideoxygalactose transaminase